ARVRAVSCSVLVGGDRYRTRRADAPGARIPGPGAPRAHPRRHGASGDTLEKFAAAETWHLKLIVFSQVVVNRRL
ncbi:MAG: hypothetical protein WAS01_06230, partial [Nostocoides sp.]